MFTLDTNQNNDIYLDKYGNLATVYNKDAIAKICENIIRTQYQEMSLRQDLGIDYLNNVFINSQIGYQFLDASIRKAIKNVQGIKNIKSLNISFLNNVLSYSLTIETIYGTNNISS